ncbi:uroporphyrinogen-III synthase [Sulfitobacter sp. PS-8MA]|uniref:uroporphyrinogen-III synthase n=1 Tax=Sulfitobacter sp. PS-8MA TaxID=3237707 RepID=UPI0034C6D651
MAQPRLLLTRPPKGSAQFLDRLSPALHEGVVISPLLEITPSEGQADLSPYAGVIFTSANAVANAPAGAGRPAYCVGPQTTEAALAAGWRAQMAGYDAVSMVAELSGRADLGPLLHLAGRHRRGDVAGDLTATGLTTDVHTLYDQRLLPLSDEAQSLLRSGDPVLVPLFSPRSAEQFVQSAASTANVLAVSISDAAAGALEGLPLRAHDVAALPTGEAMAEAVEKLFRRSTLP